MAAIGIDFGTTNSVVSQYDDGKVEPIRISEPPAEWIELGFEQLFPSIFGIDDENNPKFGWDAKILPNNQKVEAVKRLMSDSQQVIVGDEVLSNEEVASLLLGHLRKSAALESAQAFEKVVLTVPANIRGSSRKRIKTSAAMSQLKVLALINEPTAAAMSTATQNNITNGMIMVVDWGGGTLDVTVLEIKDNIFLERASAGIPVLGGLDFDAAIMKYLTEQHKEIAKYSQLESTLLRLEIERCKILLSSKKKATIRMPRGESINFTRGEFEEITKDLLERSREPLQRCLEDIKQSHSNGMSAIDHLMLVGGTCLIPSVRDFVSETVQIEPGPVANPMTTTSEGAAIASAILQGELKDFDFQVTTQNALGVLAVKESETDPHFSTIIPRNQNLPAQGMYHFAPLMDNQKWLDLVVVEGDPEKSLDDRESVELQRWRIPIKDPRPMKDIRFEITYQYNTDGEIHIKVDNAFDSSSLFAADVMMTTAEKRELVSASKNSRDTINSGALKRQPTAPKVHEGLSSDLTEDIIICRTKIVPFIDQEEAASLLELCDRIIETKASDTVLIQSLYNFKDKYGYLT